MKSKITAMAISHVGPELLRTSRAAGGKKPNSPPRLEFSRMLVHWRQYTEFRLSRLCR